MGSPRMTHFRRSNLIALTLSTLSVSEAVMPMKVTVKDITNFDDWKFSTKVNENYLPFEIGLWKSEILYDCPIA